MLDGHGPPARLASSARSDASVSWLPLISDGVVQTDPNTATPRSGSWVIGRTNHSSRVMRQAFAAVMVAG